MPLSLPDVLAAILMLALNGYVLLGGADFGGGVWDLLASGPRRARQRELIAHAMGPMWEANHVWLILAVVLLFSGFPPVFATLAIVLHIPLTLLLIGVVLRGSAFTFRAYGHEHDAAQRRWGLVFSVASLVTPMLLGVAIGAVASGRVQGYGGGTFRQEFVTPWLTAFGLSVGLLAVTLFAFLAAVYLTLETTDEDLREDFRRRGLYSGFAVFAAALLSLISSYHEAPLMRHGLILSARAIPVQLLTGIAAVTALGALWFRRWQLARVAAAAQVSLILWGWGVAQYPYLLPPTVTISEAAAPPVTLKLMLGALAVGAVVLLPSLAYLFRIFKRQRG